MAVARRGRSRVDGILELASGVLIALAALALFHVSWTAGGVGLDTVHAQETIARNAGFPDAGHADGVAQAEEGEPPVDGEPLDGQFVGWMHIPRLGADWRRVIQQGTDQVVLDNLGLGHYPGTAMPGGVGNSAFAGHRTPADLGYADRLEHGDAIVIETADAWYVYRVDVTWVTDASDTSVLAADGDSRTLTLTTCEPMWVEPAPERLIVRAHLAYWARHEGTPIELLGEDVDDASPSGVLARVRETVRDVSVSMPVSPLLCAACLGLWAVLALLSFLLWRGDRPKRVRSWNVMVLLWRLQSGPVVWRAFLYALMWLGVMFACWAWLCPWLASWVPWLDTPNPGLTSSPS